MVKPPCAMATSGFDSSDDETAEEELRPLPISWLSLSPVYSSESLGLCSLPGKKCSLKLADIFEAEERDTKAHLQNIIMQDHTSEWFKDVRRNLQKDIEELKNYGTQDIFVLCTRGELLKYRVPNLIDAYQQHGICVHHYPIPDGDIPDIAKCCKILEELRSCLEIVTVASGAHVSLSDTLAPQQVIDSLRNLRGSGAIQTIKQYNYLHEFRENLAAHLATKDTTFRSVSR